MFDLSIGDGCVQSSWVNFFCQISRLLGQQIQTLQHITMSRFHIYYRMDNYKILSWHVLRFFLIIYTEINYLTVVYYFSLKRILIHLRYKSYPVKSQRLLLVFHLYQFTQLVCQGNVSYHQAKPLVCRVLLNLSKIMKDNEVDILSSINYLQ